MDAVLLKLKGISCILSVLSYQTDTTLFRYQSEALEFLSESLDSCIDELKKPNTNE